jgi:hypothetical protein
MVFSGMAALLNAGTSVCGSAGVLLAQTIVQPTVVSGGKSFVVPGIVVGVLVAAALYAVGHSSGRS